MAALNKKPAPANETIAPAKSRRDAPYAANAPPIVPTSARVAGDQFALNTSIDSPRRGLPPLKALQRSGAARADAGSLLRSLQRAVLWVAGGQSPPALARGPARIREFVATLTCTLEQKMPAVTADNQFQNALEQLNRVEPEVLALLSRMEPGRRTHDKRLLDEFRHLLLKVREATCIHEAIGRLMVWPADHSDGPPNIEVALQLNRAAVVQVVAYIIASHYARQWPEVIGEQERAPLEDARRVLAAGQMWRGRIDVGFARRTLSRLKRWVAGKDPMGGADLDSRIDSALHGRHAVAALGRIDLQGVAGPAAPEGITATELVSLGVRHLQERQLGYKNPTPLPLYELLSACARLELALALGNSSADVYLGKALLSALRVTCYIAAAEALWTMAGRTRDLAGCVREMRREIARSRQMLAESNRQWWWDLVRRVKRPAAVTPFAMKINARQASAVIDELSDLIRGRKLPFLQRRRKSRPQSLKHYRRKVLEVSRQVLGISDEPVPIAGRKTQLASKSSGRKEAA